MSDYQQKDNTGALFRNDRKERDTQTDYNGSCMVGGVEYYMNTWINETTSGKKYMKISFVPKNQQQQLQHSVAPEKPAMQQQPFEEIPF